jgi:hypothetical protein
MENRQHRGSGPEFGPGIKFAVERGWLDLHESAGCSRQPTAGRSR